jgi:hypothetical protein
VTGPAGNIPLRSDVCQQIKSALAVLARFV